MLGWLGSQEAEEHQIKAIELMADTVSKLVDGSVRQLSMIESLTGAVAHLHDRIAAIESILCEKGLAERTAMTRQ